MGECLSCVCIGTRREREGAPGVSASFLDLGAAHTRVLSVSSMSCECMCPFLCLLLVKSGKHNVVGAQDPTAALCWGSSDPISRNHLSWEATAYTCACPGTEQATPQGGGPLPRWLRQDTCAGSRRPGLGSSSRRAQGHVRCILIPAASFPCEILFGVRG